MRHQHTEYLRPSTIAGIVVALIAAALTGWVLMRTTADHGQLSVRAVISDPEADTASITVIVADGDQVIATRRIDPRPDHRSAIGRPRNDSGADPP